MDDNICYLSGRDLFPVIKEQLSLGHRVCFTVSGTSMTPWIIHNRDQVEVIDAHGLRLRKGDIILFEPFHGKYVLHRITALVPGGYVTTGDGNLHRDCIVSSELVIGKVIRIHRKGKTIDCSALRWKALFWLWMALFPVRRWIFALCRHCPLRRTARR